MFLFALSTLPAHAQYGYGGYGGYETGWQAIPCNPDGSTPVNTSSGYYGYGRFMPLTGTQSGTASNTYPQAMKDAAKNGYSYLLDAFGPSDETQFPYLPAPPATVPAKIFDGYRSQDGIGFATPYSSTGAGNSNPLALGEYYQYHSHSVGTYPAMDGQGNLVRDQNNIPVVGGSINGSVSADVTGRLWGFYKVYYGYSGYDGFTLVPPDNDPMPDHINLLLQTNVTAYASAGKPADAAGKVTSKATASIPFFGETISQTADGDNPFLQFSQSITGRHLVRSAVAPLSPFTGIATVYVDGEVHTQASNGVAYDQKRTMDYEGGTQTFDTQNPAGAGTWSFVTAGVKQDPRDIWISSGIEDSYYKGKTPPDGLPDESDRYAHIRAAGGAMTVDTIITHINDLNTGPHYMGYGNFDANTPGFSWPTNYDWSLAGAGKPGLTVTAAMIHSPDNQYGVRSLPVDLDFGKDWGSSATFKTTLITLTATDGYGTDHLQASNTYTVNWHLPVEWNPGFIGTQTTSNRMYPGLAKNRYQSTEIGPNDQANFNTPLPEDDVAGPAVKATTVFLGAASPAVALLPEEIMSGPVGIATASLLAAASAATGFLVPPDAPLESRVADYKEFAADVQHQLTINNTGNGDIQRFNSDPKQLNEALDEIARLQALYGDPGYLGHWEEDKFFFQLKGTLRASVQVGRARSLDSYQGDAYDPHGYVGVTYATLTRDRNEIWVFTWTYAPLSQTPPSGQPSPNP